MRKIAIAATAGFALLAGQAVAAGQSASLQVGDRVGASQGASAAFAGPAKGGLLWSEDGLTAVGYWVLGVSGLVITGYFVLDDDKSKSP